MGKKSQKTSHRASLAVIKSSERAKKDILELYARLGRKNVPIDSEDPMFSGLNEKGIEVGGVVELLRSAVPELLINGLRQLAYIAETIDTLPFLPLIIQIIRTCSDKEVRFEATRTISRMRDDRAAPDLIRVIENDSSEKVKEGAVRALGFIRARECFDYLSDLISDIWNQSIRVRKAAVFSLGRLDPSLAVNILCDCLMNDPDKEVRKEAAEAVAVCILKLEKNLAGSVATNISSQINNESESEPDVRIAVINAVTMAENTDCIDRLILALKSDPNPRVRGEAAHALAHFFDPRIEKALIESFNAEDDVVKKRIALAVARYAMKNPLGMHDEMCHVLIYIQKLFPRGSYVWKEAVRALPAC